MSAAWRYRVVFLTTSTTVPGKAVSGPPRTPAAPRPQAGALDTAEAQARAAGWAFTRVAAAAQLPALDALPDGWPTAPSAGPGDGWHLWLQDSWLLSPGQLERWQQHLDKLSPEVALVAGVVQKPLPGERSPLATFQAQRATALLSHLADGAEIPACRMALGPLAVRHSALLQAGSTTRALLTFAAVATCLARRLYVQGHRLVLFRGAPVRWRNPPVGTLDAHAAYRHAIKIWCDEGFDALTLLHRYRDPFGPSLLRERLEAVAQQRPTVASLSAELMAVEAALMASQRPSSKHVMALQPALGQLHVLSALQGTRDHPLHTVLWPRAPHRPGKAEVTRHA